MGDWPVLSHTKWGQDDLTFNPYSVTVTPHASANTKSVYTQIVAATPFDVFGLILDYNVLMATTKLLDIAVGAVGAERVVVPNFLIYSTQGGGFQANNQACKFVPIFIRKGERIAVRFQGNTGSATLTLKVQLLGGGGFASFQSPTKYEAWGANAAASSGIACTSGGANTKGAYVALIAATGLTSRWVLLSIGSNQSVSDIALDVAVGGAGSEQVVIPNLYHRNQNAQAACLLLPWVVPKGTRVAIRCAASAGTQTTQAHILAGA